MLVLGVSGDPVLFHFSSHTVIRDEGWCSGGGPLKKENNVQAKSACFSCSYTKTDANVNMKITLL